MHITYTQANDYFIPNFALPGNLNKYGRARLSYLREHKRLLHTHMLTQGILWSHLVEIQQIAETRHEHLVSQMMQAQGIIEQLKADNQLLWLQRVNNIYNQANELIYRELIHT